MAQAKTAAPSPQMTFPADRIERRRIADLVPYPRNPKTHPPEQISDLKAMIVEFGFHQPVVIDEDNMILIGHGRVMAARELGWTELPCVPLFGLTPAQKRAAVIADNRSHEKGGWDNALLALELGELKQLNYNLELTGFSVSDLAVFVSGQNEQQQQRQQQIGNLAEKFGVAPFTTLNAREGWWQDRKRAWVALGIRSELGRGAPTGGSPNIMDRANATPGGSPMPSASYSKDKARGDGRGRPMEKT